MNLNYGFMISDIPVVLGALPVTLLLAVISMLGAIVISVIFGTMILKDIIVVKQFVYGLNTFLKGIPLMVQLLLCYYGIPYILKAFDGFLGFEYNPKSISYFACAIVAFSFNYGAYMTDVVISSYRAVNKGQLEAAYAIGMTPLQGIVRIVAPQAIEIAFPNLVNYFMWLLKATSLASVVNVFEMLSVAKASTADNYAILEGYIVAALIYWVVCEIVEKTLLKWRIRNV